MPVRAQSPHLTSIGTDGRERLTALILEYVIGELPGSSLFQGRNDLPLKPSDGILIPYFWYQNTVQIKYISFFTSSRHLVILDDTDRWSLFFYFDTSGHMNKWLFSRRISRNCFINHYCRSDKSNRDRKWITVCSKAVRVYDLSVAPNMV